MTDSSSTQDSSAPRNERVRAWLEAAEADADRRGLPELKPILRQWARSTEALRAADWNDPAASS